MLVFLITSLTCGLFVIPIFCDICFYKEDGSGLLNVNHQIYINGQCYPCFTPCLSCQSIEDVSCSSGNCELYYFFNSQSSRCQRCWSLCQQCTGPLQSECQICIQGYYFDRLELKCRSCPFQAKNCDGMIIYSCLQMYFMDSQSNNCRKCSGNCLQCSSLSSCQNCELGFYLTSENICQSCKSNNCIACINESICFQCQEGYQLISSQNQCRSLACSQPNCIGCSFDTSKCTLCAPQFYLFEQQCYFGSSLLCRSGTNGSSYGKCRLCRQQYAFSTELSPSYCLLSTSGTKTLGLEFQSFSDAFLCDSPEFLSSHPLSEHRIHLTIEPLFQIDLEVRLISQLATSQISMVISDSEGLGTYLNLNQSIAKAGEFYCKQNGSSNNKLFLNRISESFYITSLASSIILTISSLDNKTEIYLSEILIAKQVCSVQHCKACFTTQLCAFCNEGYFLQQFTCKTTCSPGFYTNYYQNKCIYDCEPGYYLSIEQSSCQKCQHQCSLCQDINQCTACKSGYFLHEKMCLNTCPDNTTYPSPVSNECLACRNPCKTCSTNSQNCTSCSRGYLLNFKCIVQCPAPYFSNFLNQSAICTVCSSNCKTCSFNANFCSSCSAQLALYNGNCGTGCPVRYFKQNLGEDWTKDAVCVKCLPICKACNAISSNCVSCSSGYLLWVSKGYLTEIENRIQNKEVERLFEVFIELSEKNNTSNETFAGICISQCPSYYFFSNQTTATCDSCAIGCIKCQSDKKCIECNDGYFLQDGVCSSVCNSLAAFMDKSTKRCRPCIIPCRECLTNYQGSNCINCIEGYYYLPLKANQTSPLDSGTCLLRCPQGFYKDNQTQPKCIACPSQCAQCQNLTKCSSCKDGYFLSDLFQCLGQINCSDGYFFSTESSTCRKCKASCVKCADFEYFCVQCQSSLHLLSSQGLCLEQCILGYFAHTIYLKSPDFTIILNPNQFLNPNQLKNATYKARNICQLCSQNCTSCISDSHCTQCQDEFYFLNGSCSSTCPEHYYQSQTEDGKTCQLCSPNCQSCVSSRVCTQCNQNLVLVESQCYESCFEGFYVKQSFNSDGQTIRKCLQCPEQCQSCKSQTSCLSCNPNYFLQLDSISGQGECSSSCPEQKYPNKISKTCQNCKYPCRTCSNSLICLTCQSNLTLLNQNCVQTCPQNFYAESSSLNFSQCKSCPSPCSLCKSSTSCSRCKEGYFLNQQLQQCLLSCPQQYFENGLSNKCQKCSQPCSTCLSSGSDCQTCIEGYYFRNNLCLSICPSSTYLSLNQSQPICKNCPKQCKACTSESNCLICQQKRYLYSRTDSASTQVVQSCVSECPSGTYSDISKNSCQNCSIKCRLCKNNNFNCIACSSNEFLLKNNCLKSCPNYYFENKDTHSCQPCGKWCQICQNSSMCVKCKSGYLYQNECLNQCPVGYYPNLQASACYKCMSGCKSCRKELICEQCIAEQEYVLYFRRCINLPCPANLLYFVEENQCVSSCPYLLNKEQKKCHLAQCPSYLILSIQQKQCQRNCLEGQFISLDSKTNTIKCSSLSVLTSKNINSQQLPQFKIEIVPLSQGMIVAIMFSFEALMGMSSEQLKEKIDLRIERLAFKNKELQSSLIKSQTNFNQRNRILQIQQNVSNLSFNTSKIKITNKIAFYYIEFGNQIFQAQNEFELTIKVTGEMRNPFRSFSKQINGYTVPMQNQISEVVFNYLDYEKMERSGILSFIGLVLMIVVVMVLLAQIMRGKRRLYLFTNIIQFLQNMFFLCFISISLPSLIERLFSSYRFMAGDLVIGPALRQQDSSQVMISPWQFYKHSKDINAFANLSDIFTVFGVAFLLMIAAKVCCLLKFNPFGLKLFERILRNSIPMFQLLGWTFSSMIGLFSLINVFYWPQEKDKYRSQLQGWALYQVVCYSLGLMYFCTVAYYFYHQYNSPVRFDAGLNVQKRRLGISIPLYKYVRRFIFIFFMAYHHQNPIYCVCIYLMSTSIIFILIFWYEPYINQIRQKLAVIEEASAFLFFSQILLFLLNPEYYHYLQYFIIIHSIAHTLLIIAYPIYSQYIWIRYSQNIELPALEEINLDEKSELTDKCIGVEQRNQDNQKQNDLNGNKIEKKLYGNQQFIAQNDRIIKNTQDSRMRYVDSNAKGNLSLNLNGNQQQQYEGNQGHQADQSQQGQVLKRNIMSNVLRLAKKQTKKRKEFKNYDFSEQEQEQQQVQQEQQYGSSRQQFKFDNPKLKNDQTLDYEDVKMKKAQYKINAEIPQQFKKQKILQGNKGNAKSIQQQSKDLQSSKIKKYQF